MQKGICVRLSGPGVEEAAKSLTMCLIEMGRHAEHIGMTAVKRFGTGKAAGDVCGLLVENGVVLVLTHPKVRPDGNRVDVAIASNDAPDAAAKKVIAQLAGLGIVSLESVKHSPAEKALIRERLANRGYAE